VHWEGAYRVGEVGATGRTICRMYEPTGSYDSRGS
jgi:hypothetical protein